MILYIILDISVVLIAFFIVNYRRSLTFYHPGIILLFYHVFVYSFRFYSVLNGSELFLSDSSFQQVSLDELARALLLADLALISCAVAIFLAEHKQLKVRTIQGLSVNNDVLKYILFFTIPLGIWGAVTQLYIPVLGNNFTINVETGYVAITQSWFGLSMLALIYFKGFKKTYLIPLFIYLFIIGIQGFHRYRLILPTLFLVVTYLYYAGLKWPKRSQIALLLGLLIIFAPLKHVGRAFQKGDNISNIAVIIRDSFKSTVNAEGDQAVMDQYAMALSAVDKNNTFLLGGTLAPLITMPIPRSLWPEKPNLAQWVVDLSSPDRPFDKLGAALSIYGEAYANFGYLGILFIPAILFYLLTRWYKTILVKPTFDLDKFFYTLVFCCMVQVMRDGLYSLVVFPIVNSMPLFLVFAVNKLWLRRIRYYKTNEIILK